MTLRFGRRFGTRGRHLDFWRGRVFGRVHLGMLFVKVRHMNAVPGAIVIHYPIGVVFFIASILGGQLW